MLWNLGRAVRARRRLATLGLALLVFLGTGVGAGAYASHHWRSAKAAVTAGRYQQARDSVRVCLFFWPRNVEVRLLAARSARILGDLEGAEAHLNECLKLKGGATEAIQLEFLLLRVQTGDVDEVAPALLDCVDKKHPESSLILDTLARSYISNLRYKPAYACLSCWIEEDPTSAKPYHWRGWVQERLNNHKRAMEDYLRALELDPDLAAVRLRVAEMLLEDKQPLEALPHLERLRQQIPDRPAVLARLGQCRFLQGQLDEARPLLEAAAEKLPNDPGLLLHLAKLELQEGRPAEAEPWLRRVLKADPYDSEARYTLASCLQLQGRPEAAAAELEQQKQYAAELERANELLKGEALRPSNDPGPAAEAGSLLLRMGRERVGLYWLHEALRRDPGHQPAHKALVSYYESNDEPEKAAAHRRRLRP